VSSSSPSVSKRGSWLRCSRKALDVAAAVRPSSLRCAGAPGRPAGGSKLSLPFRAAVLQIGRNVLICILSNCYGRHRRKYRGLDHSHSYRNMHRTRDQRLSAGRVLINSSSRTATVSHLKCLTPHWASHGDQCWCRSRLPGNQAVAVTADAAAGGRDSPMPCAGPASPPTRMGPIASSG
jgi:hypothetical protein